MSWLLDTNVISELVRRQPEPKVVEWVDTQPESTLFLSIITLGEIKKGIAKLRDGRKKFRRYSQTKTGLPLAGQSHSLTYDRVAS